MELDTRGREAALLALTLIREDRTRREKCCVSSSSIRSHSSQVRVSPFVARNGLAGAFRLGPLSRAKRTLRFSSVEVS